MLACQFKFVFASIRFKITLGYMVIFFKQEKDAVKRMEAEAMSAAL